jgi:hypothetical protein
MKSKFKIYFKSVFSNFSNFSKIISQENFREGRSLIMAHIMLRDELTQIPSTKKP